VQVGAPRDLYDRPGSAHVARFFGENNLIAGHVTGVSGSIAKVETALGVLAGHCDPAQGYVGGDAVLLTIRPEKIRLLPVGAPSPALETTIPGQIARSGFAGPLTQLHLCPDAAPDLMISVKRLSDASAAASAAQVSARASWSTADTWVVRA